MSRYENYEIKNNVFGTLSAPISSLATTIQLGDGQGARFSVNMLATLENIENGKVMKREIVLITAINGDTLTVTRKYAPCPSNDEANTQGQVSYAFSTDDTISAYIDKEHFDELDKSINDIYDNGVNKLRTEVISGLQIKVNAGPVLVGSAYYDFDGGNLTLTDNATNYVEIDEDGFLVSNTTDWGDKHTKIAKVITSGGTVTSIEDWRLGTVGGEIGGVNIHDLTEKSKLLSEDELIVSDSEAIRQNKKIKAKSILGIGNCFCSENINGGDFVFINDIPETSAIVNYEGVGFSTQSQKVAIRRFGNGTTFDTISIYLGKVGTPTNDLSIRIETDNGGVPSGTLVSADATGSISANDISGDGIYNISLGGDIQITNGQMVYIVFSMNANDSSNYYKIGSDNNLNSIFTQLYFDGNDWNNRQDFSSYDFINAVSVGTISVIGIGNFGKNGTKYYTAGTQYDLTTPYDPTTATNGQNYQASIGGFPPIVSPDGTHLVSIVYNSGTVSFKCYTTSTPRDFSGTVTTTTYSYGYSPAYGNMGFAMSPDGTKMFGGQQANTIWEFTLSTPRDITTATNTGTLNYTVNNPPYFAMTNDGKYVVTGKGQVYELSTPRSFDSYSLIKDFSFSVYADSGIFFDDGEYMYVGRPSSLSKYKVGKKFGVNGDTYIVCDGLYNYQCGLANCENRIPAIPMSAVNDFSLGDSITYNVIVNNLLSNLSVGQKYYLSDTPGEIQTTPGTNEFEVGIAIEPTILKLKQTY